MKLVFFLLFALVLASTLLNLDWQSKFIELGQDKKVQAIRQFFEHQEVPESLPEPVDTPAADDYLQELNLNAIESMNTLPADTLPMPGQHVDREIRSKDFADLSERPYMDESRQLLRRIRRNYEKMLSEADSLK